MKYVPARSKTSRLGLFRTTSVSCSARNGIVTRSSSPLTMIVMVPGRTSTSIVTRSGPLIIGTPAGGEPTSAMRRGGKEGPVGAGEPEEQKRNRATS